jgi:hypothetical protein
MDASPSLFYRPTPFILLLLCSESAELASAFVANRGVAFLLEYLETFSSDQVLLRAGFALYRGVIEGLDNNASVAIAGMILGKLVDIFELNIETADEDFYFHYCSAVSMSVPSAIDPDANEQLHERIVSHVWLGIIKHKDDDEAQALGRRLLRHLVGAEKAKEMIDHADLRHCAEEYCAGCA